MAFISEVVLGLYIRGFFAFYKRYSAKHRAPARQLGLRYSKGKLDEYIEIAEIR